MLYLIGLGINDEKDVSLKGIETLKKCDEIYCEMFTNKWLGNLTFLEKRCGKKINILDRKRTESSLLLKKSKTMDVALLVPGDPLAATTHFSLIAEAKKQGLEVSVIHASSIFTAIAETGLHLYKFGRTATLCFVKKGFLPVSPFEQIMENEKQGLHTLVLLDVDQENHRYMSVAEALELLINNDDKYKDMKIIAACCLGSKKQKIIYRKCSDLAKERFEEPAVILIPGKLNFSEEEAMELWR